MSPTRRSTSRSRRLRSTIVASCLTASVAVIGLAFGCASKTPVEPACTYAVSPLTASVAASGGSGAITVTTTASCTWTAQSNSPWLTLPAGASGTGSGQVTFTAVANGDQTPRSGVIGIAGQSVTIAQGGAPVIPDCTYSIQPEQAQYAEDGGTGTIAVTTTAGCAWTASSSAPWVIITAPGPNTGSGAAAYRVEANLAPPERTASITVAGRTATITQRGNVASCQYSVAPVDFTPCMASTELTSTITTQAACPWTVASTGDWLSVTSGLSGSGTGTIRFRVTDNWDLPRFGQLLVRWPTPSAGQNVRVNQAGCRYAVTPGVFSIAPAGGAFQFNVFQESDPNECGGPLQNGCVWSAESTASWIVVTTTGTRKGDDAVSFTVAANATRASRSGTITVRDQVVRITQQP
jgi:hypothetical protein